MSRTETIKQPTTTTEKPRIVRVSCCRTGGNWIADVKARNGRVIAETGVHAFKESALRAAVRIAQARGWVVEG